MNKLTDLEVYNSARKLRKLISSVCSTFPDEEKYRLKNQIIRSSRSVPANIAEGFGRFHYQENIQHCRIARGSLYETQEHLVCAFDENLISEELFMEVNNQILHCLKVLNGYISYLKKSKRT